MRTAIRPRLCVLLEPERRGAEHMRRDTTLLAAAAPDSVVLRLYTWSPPAVSIGHMQRAAALLDADACAAAGVDVVQRPTGGRAVLHWEEITYAVVADVREERFGGSLAASHTVIGECLLAALARLGVQAQLARPSPGRDAQLLQRPCFVSSGRAEILVGGRKLVGSAQRRSATGFLQHGSLLLGPAHERLADLLLETRGDPQRAAAVRATLRRSTTTLGDLLDAPPDFGTVAAALVDGFASRLELQPSVQHP